MDFQNASCAKVICKSHNISMTLLEMIQHGFVRIKASVILERLFAIAVIPDMSMVVCDTRASRPSDKAGVMLSNVFNEISCAPEIIAIVCASVIHWSDIMFHEKVLYCKPILSM